MAHAGTLVEWEHKCAKNASISRRSAALCGHVHKHVRTLEHTHANMGNMELLGIPISSAPLPSGCVRVSVYTVLVLVRCALLVMFVSLLLLLWPMIWSTYIHACVRMFHRAHEHAHIVERFDAPHNHTQHLGPEWCGEGGCREGSIAFMRSSCRHVDRACCTRRRRCASVHDRVLEPRDRASELWAAQRECVCVCVFFNQI